MRAPQVLGVCASSRPFILENAGVQRQLIELEAKVASSPRSPLDAGESPSASFKKRQRLNRPTSLAPTGELDEGPRSSPFIDSEAEWETVQVWSRQRVPFRADSPQGRACGVEGVALK